MRVEARKGDVSNLKSGSDIGGMQSLQVHGHWLTMTCKKRNKSHQLVIPEVQNGKGPRGSRFRDLMVDESDSRKENMDDVILHGDNGKSVNKEIKEGHLMWRQKKVDCTSSK